jgi:hypothetical protein
MEPLAESVVMGEKVKRIRRKVHEPPKGTEVELNTTDQFLAYILDKGPDTLPKSTTSQRYSTNNLQFNGAIPIGLYHIFGVAKDLLGSSYRPKECNLAVGKINY